MSSLQKLKEQLVSEVSIYIDGYTYLSEDDIFTLKTDISQMITDTIEDAEERND
tara:strand:+ start:1007 stop:1168 length:162 start_codon:yes stop_codon:yes gene_type:complete